MAMSYGGNTDFGAHQQTLMSPTCGGLKLKFQIFVKMPNGRTVTVDICKTNTILELKNKIQDKEGIPIEL